MLLPLSHTHPYLNIPRFSHNLTLTHTSHIHMYTPPTCPPRYSPPVSSRANRWFCAPQVGKRMHCGLVSYTPDCARPRASLSRRPCCWVAVTLPPQRYHRPQGSVPAVQVPLSCRLTLASASRARQRQWQPRLPIRSEPWAQPTWQQLPARDPQRSGSQGQASSRPG